MSVDMTCDNDLRWVRVSGKWCLLRGEEVIARDVPLPEPVDGADSEPVEIRRARYAIDRVDHARQGALGHCVDAALMYLAHAQGALDRARGAEPCEDTDVEVKAVAGHVERAQHWLEAGRRVR